MKEIMLSACGAVVLVDVLQIILVKRKPFNCSVCLSGWFSGVWTAFFYPFWEVPFRMAAAMIVSIMITWMIKKTI